MVVNGWAKPLYLCREHPVHRVHWSVARRRLTGGPEVGWRADLVLGGEAVQAGAHPRGPVEARRTCSRLWEVAPRVEGRTKRLVTDAAVVGVGADGACGARSGRGGCGMQRGRVRDAAPSPGRTAGGGGDGGPGRGEGLSGSDSERVSVSGSAPFDARVRGARGPVLNPAAAVHVRLRRAVDAPTN